MSRRLLCRLFRQLGNHILEGQQPRRRAKTILSIPRAPPFAKSHATGREDSRLVDMFPLCVPFLVIRRPFGSGQVDQAERAYPGSLVLAPRVVLPTSLGTGLDDLYHNRPHDISLLCKRARRRDGKLELTILKTL